MRNVIYHILGPAILPAVFFRIATTPVEVLGCRTRGLIALLITFISVLAGLGTAMVSARRRKRGDPSAIWWVASSIILAIPGVAFIILA
jgi:ABC-type dipeptide/oligopeptide/nickel transport system permease subunit